MVEVDSPAEDTYVERTVNLAAYAGEDVYLVFRYTGVFADSWYIDDIEVDLR